MKARKIFALLLCVALLCALLPSSVFAASEPYFIAINDEFPLLTQQTEPIRVGGVSYIPCTIFDSRVTGAGLDVSYRWDANTEKLSLYSRTRSIEFDVKTGTAYSFDEDKEYAYQAIVRGSLPYVPAVSACNYFSLSCTFPVTDDAKYQILRIKNGNQILSDTLFMRSARPHLDERMTQYNQQLSNETNKNPNSNGTNQPAQPETPETSERGNSLYLGIRVDSSTNLSATLAALGTHRQLKAVFFFEPAALASRDELLREIVGRGHRVGLILNGNSKRTVLEGLHEGNRVLAHILRREASFAITDNANEDIRNALSDAGCIRWSPHLSISGAGRSDSANYQSILTQVTARKGRTRLLLDDQIKGGTLTSALRKLSDEAYDLRAMRETDY